MSDPNVPQPGAPTEPLLKVGGLVGFLVALFAVLVSFGIHISNDQQSALLGFAAVVGPLIVALGGRWKVWSPASVRELALRLTRSSKPAMPTTTTTDIKDV